MDNINVTVDSSVLEEKAKDFAMKGALKAIEDFYTAYDSPYKKQITEHLLKNEIGSGRFNLPDIISLINEHLTIEIDKIANTAIAKTFVPLVTKLLIRQEKESIFSNILKQFIKTADYDNDKIDNFSIMVRKNEKYGWIDVGMEDSKRSYTFTLHEEYESKKTQNIKYSLLSLPCSTDKERQIMKLNIDGATLELPFTRDILKDNFLMYLAGYIISDTIITMDTLEFDEDMFPETCHCH